MGREIEDESGFYQLCSRESKAHFLLTVFMAERRTRREVN